jgi:4-diphosphocytidyl-2-C-methyl-D-erythritol kinase
MSALYDIAAPAKINLFLHVVGRMPNGYHALQSVFMLVDWCDRLHIETRDSPSITRLDLGPPLPPNDLCVQAATALQAASGVTMGAHITLDKQLPAQAGMGGGSSDAAACLLALARLWQVALPRPTMAELALRLGADVPFFLLGQHAWVEGIGQNLQPVALPKARFWVLKPPVGLSTPAIFGSPSLKRDSEAATILRFAALGPEQIFKFGRNDLQPVAQTLCPEIDQGLKWLDERGLQGRMTGSGSAVFAHLPGQGSADTGLGKPADGWTARVCSTLEVHPLADW